MNLIVAVLEIALAASFAQAPEPAPNLNVDGVDGHRMVIHPAVLQKPLLLHFFSLQLPGWQDELLRLKAFEARFEKDGLAVLSFAAPEPEAGRILADFAAGSRIGFPVAIDSGNLSAFSGEKVPHAVLIAPDGTVALRLYKPLAEEQLSAIAALLPELFAQRRTRVEKARAEARRRKEIDAAAALVAVLTPEQLASRQGAPPVLFFIGQKSVFDEKHIAGAVHLDLNDVDRYFADKDPGQEYVFYCDCSSALGRSGLVAAQLYMKGFKRAAYLQGHLEGWEKKGLPLERRK